jgi:hypothetical protein
MVQIKHMNIRSDRIVCQSLSTLSWGDEGPDG